MWWGVETKSIVTYLLHSRCKRERKLIDDVLNAFRPQIMVQYKRITAKKMDEKQNTFFRKKRFEINFFVRRNALNFAIFIEKENPHSLFCFSFRATFSFTL